ncbi:FHA domain-containing protein [bacterium]|nr:FHA domain-containing protein [bacterium]
MLKAKLLVIGGDAKFGEVDLLLPTTIGRGREATLTIPHPLVSRLHCEIFERHGKLVVKDLKSLNGTFVNNQKIIGEEVLEPEQLLTLGNVTFRAVYCVGESSQADAAEQLATVSAEQAQVKTVCETELNEPESNEKETVYNQNADSEKLAGVSERIDEAVAAAHGVASQLDTIQLDVPEIKQSNSGTPEQPAASLVRKLPR